MGQNFSQTQKSFIGGEISGASLARLGNNYQFSADRIENFIINKDGSLEARKGFSANTVVTKTALQVTDSNPIIKQIKLDEVRIFLHEINNIPRISFIKADGTAQQIEFRGNKINAYNITNGNRDIQDLSLFASFEDETRTIELNTLDSISVTEPQNIKLLNNILYVFFDNHNPFKIFKIENLLVVAPFWANSNLDPNIINIQNKFPFFGEKQLISEDVYYIQNGTVYYPKKANTKLRLQIRDEDLDAGTCKVALKLDDIAETSSFINLDKMTLGDYENKPIVLIIKTPEVDIGIDNSYTNLPEPLATTYKSLFPSEDNSSQTLGDSLRSLLEASYSSFLIDIATDTFTKVNQATFVYGRFNNAPNFILSNFDGTAPTEPANAESGKIYFNYSSPTYKVRDLPDSEVNTDLTNEIFRNLILALGYRMYMIIPKDVITYTGTAPIGNANLIPYSEYLTKLNANSDEVWRNASIIEFGFKSNLENSSNDRIIGGSDYSNAQTISEAEDFFITDFASKYAQDVANLNSKHFFTTDKDIITFSKDNSEDLTNSSAGLILKKSSLYKHGENLYGKPIIEDYSETYSAIKDSGKIDYSASVRIGIVQPYRFSLQDPLRYSEQGYVYVHLTPNGYTIGGSTANNIPSNASHRYDSSGFNFLDLSNYTPTLVSDTSASSLNRTGSLFNLLKREKEGTDSASIILSSARSFKLIDRNSSNLEIDTFLTPSIGNLNLVSEHLFIFTNAGVFFIENNVNLAEQGFFSTKKVSKDVLEAGTNPISIYNKIYYKSSNQELNFVVFDDRRKLFIPNTPYRENQIAIKHLHTFYDFENNKMLALGENNQIFIINLEPDGSIGYMSRWSVDNQELLSYGEETKEFFFSGTDNLCFANQSGTEDFGELFNAEVDILSLSKTRYFPDHANQLRRTVNGFTIFSDNLREVTVLYRGDNCVIENAGLPLNSITTCRSPFKIENNYHDNTSYPLTFRIRSDDNGCLDGINFFGSLDEIG